MNKEAALDFLKNRQPMPADNSPACTEFLLEKYRQTLHYLTDNPHDEAIPLLLNSFGKGDASGLYTLVDDVLLAADHQVVIDAMCKILKSKDTLLSVRYWVTVFAYDFAEKEDNSNLLAALSNSKTLVEKLLRSGDKDTRVAAQEIMDFIVDWEEE